MKMFKDVTMMVMSGTGNTFRTAKWIEDQASARGCSARTMMIDNISTDKFPVRGKDKLFVAMFPAHGLMTPWSMLKFLITIPHGNGSGALSISTRGGIPVGGVVLPGAVGLGNFIAAFIFLLKGYRVRGWLSVDMPVNMISLHWGMNLSNIDRVLARARRKIDPVLPTVLAGRKAFYFLNTLWDGIWGAGMIYLAPGFPILYLLYGKLFMGKLMFSDNRCIGCGLCAKFCPNDAIIMRNINRKKVPFWSFHCEACLRCMGFCRQKAVQAGHSWGVILYYATTIPFIIHLLRRIEPLDSLLSNVTNYWAWSTVQLVDIIPAVIISYWIFWLLIRIPFINTLFSYTTLTRYFRRYHEPGTRLKDYLGKRR